MHLLNDHASNELEMVSDEKLEQNKDGKQAKKEDWMVMKCTAGKPWETYR